MPDSQINDYTPVDISSDNKVSLTMGRGSMSKSNAAIEGLLPRQLLGAAFGLQRWSTKSVSHRNPAQLCVALALTIPLLAIDANASDFNRRAYIGANIGLSQLDPDASGIGATVDEKNDLSFGFNLGMDINNRLSAEIHANILGTATLAPEGEIDYQVYGVSAILYGLNTTESRDLRKGFSGYLRLGLDTMKNSATVPYELENNLSWVLGVGAEYGLSNGLAMRAEITRFYSDAYYGGLGVVYRFAGQSTNRAERVDTVMLAEPVVEPVAEEPVTAAVDQDNDGILDDVDQCLASNPELPVNTVGCELFNGVMEGVTFESASAILTDGAKQVLDGAARDLLNYPNIRVAVMAHTDNQGNAKVNLQLSKKRVIAVVRYLLGQGVPMNRMRAEAYGEKRPLASNETAEGRQRNRRVEFSTIN